MNILVLGATGFIGSHVTQALLNEGYNVICGVRNVGLAKKLFPKAKVLRCNFRLDTNAKIWKSRLTNIDIIINCVGIFYHPNKKVIWNIHYSTPKAIFDAAFENNVKKIIHISALNSEIYKVDYAKSKKAAEDYLLSAGIPAILLKPSLVYGIGSSGGMKLFRMLASFPFVLFVPGKGQQKFQPIHIDDLISGIIVLVKTPTQKNKILSAVSAKSISLINILKLWRKWLGLSKPIVIHTPLVMLRIANLINDLKPYSTLNSDALKMLEQNNIVSNAEAVYFQEQIGFKPKDFNEGLSATPSETQDRWYSIFIIFRPLLRISLALMWIASAITSAFLYPINLSYDLLNKAGMPIFLQPYLLYGASLINLCIGIFLLFNYKNKINYIFQIIFITCYTFIITFKIPQLWLEPFGPVVKNLPILLLIIFLFMMEQQE